MVLASVNIPAWQNMGANQAYFMWCTGKTQAYVFEYISMQKYLWQWGRKLIWKQVVKISMKLTWKFILKNSFTEKVVQI